MTANRGSLSALVAWGVLLFLHLPVAVLVAFSFNEARFGGRWRGFTFAWYQKLFAADQVWRALLFSLAVGLAVALLSAVLGTSGALALHRYHYRLKALHYGLITLPLAVPDLLMGISLLLFFVMLRMDMGFTTIVLGHTSFCLSYVCLVVMARLQQFDFSQIEAAKDLGCNGRQAFLKVVLPQILPAIAAGSLLAFTLSFDDFVITFFVSGPGSTTLPLYIYSMIKHGSPPLINALSTLLIAFTTVVTLIMRRFIREENLI